MRQTAANEVTGHPVAVFQRIDQAGYKQLIDERVLADTDTMMEFGLDHLVSEQEAALKEVDAIREWLKREGACSHRIMMWASPATRSSARWNTGTTATPLFLASSDLANTLGR